MGKPGADPKSVKSGITALTIRTKIRTLLLAVDFTILGYVTTIKASMEQLFVRQLKALQEAPRVPSISKLEVQKPWSMTNLMRNNKLPRPLGTQGYFSHAHFKQAK